MSQPLIVYTMNQEKVFYNVIFHEFFETRTYIKHWPVKHRHVNVLIIKLGGIYWVHVIVFTV